MESSPGGEGGQPMVDECVNLEVGLSYQAPKQYRVDIRYWQPQDETCQPPEIGTVQIDWEGLPSLELNTVAYGRRLAECLFGLWPPAPPTSPSRIQKQFERALEASRVLNRPVRLRMWIDRMAPELHNLRWETLQELSHDSRLTTNPQLFFSRFLSSIDRPSIA